jgi:Recombination endonuclease VII
MRKTKNRNEYQRRWLQTPKGREYRKRMLVYTRNWHHANRERVIEKRYGMKAGTYHALLVKQNGVCAICEQPPNGKALRVDHCHKTKHVRGLLCHQCNFALGHFMDNPQRAMRAAFYLVFSAGQNPTEGSAKP